MMSKTEPNKSDEVQLTSHAEADADWRQLEAFVDQLHVAAQAPIERAAFYQQLLEGCFTLLAATGGAVWVPAGQGRWRSLLQINVEQQLPHGALLQKTVGRTEPLIVPPHSRIAQQVENRSADVLLLAAINKHDEHGHDAPPHAIVELHLRPGASPAVQQGWQELLATVVQIASQFHLHEQLRTLQTERGHYDQSLALMRRFQRAGSLRQTASEIASEGRLFLNCDRLSVVLRRGTQWQLLAVSGVDRVESRSDTVKKIEALSAAIASWGEPFEYTSTTEHESSDLPPELVELADQHVDQSQARRLMAVPIEFFSEPDQQAGSKASPTKLNAVLVSEQFQTDEHELSKLRVQELAELCEPALRQATQLDRFPVRNCLRWADRWERVRDKLGLTKLAVAATTAVLLLAALIFVRTDFEVEATAVLKPVVDHDIFASATGQVVDVQVVHGQQVLAGDILAVLDDPQLSLDTERVSGEVATTRKRLEAIAVARTDRQVREESTSERLPLSAEAQQLQKRLASLQTQLEILAARREALTLRSPIAGTVLTMDVQHLLKTRPVQRGQLLFTVADTSAGWKLLAEVPQDRIGQVIEAQSELTAELPTRFRLAGNPQQTYEGHVASISTAAVIDLTNLEQESPAFEVEIAVSEQPLPLARPGMGAEVRVYCGQRSLGYVWLHDVWETVYRWLVF